MNYLPADTDVLINCGNPNGKEKDPSMTPIRLHLPKPPKLELIDGYGLAPEDQYFRRVTIPEKLVGLEKTVKRDLELKNKEDVNKRVTGIRIVNEIWSEIENNIEDYKEEVKWIKTQWYHRLNGYWFFNNGKPVYITGWHYFYLNFWKIESRIYPEYRDRNRRTFLFWDYLLKTHETFKNLDKEGKPIPNEQGEYEVEDMPSRTFLGVVEPKGRREGISNMSQSAQFEHVSRRIGNIGVIFSTGDTSASSLFKDKTVKSWKNMPFFFLPVWDGLFDVSSEINFKRPRNVVTGEELSSRITFAQSAFGIEFDGQFISFAIFDESGKTTGCDVSERWMTHKQGLTQGDGTAINGYCIHPSTVEEMEGSGGKHFQTLIYDSDFFCRNHVTGQTKSGLAYIFTPDYDCLENFVDKHGNGIIDKPTNKQINEGFKFRQGSRALQQSKRDELLNSKNPKDAIRYRQYIVKHPWFLDECFQLTTGSTSFNIDIINRRNAELRRVKDPWIKGNFEWINGFGSAVRFVEDKINGRFEVSNLNPFTPNERVRTSIVDEVTGDYKDVWMPKHPHRVTIGADPTSYNGDKSLAIETGSYQSDGGITVFLERDPRVDSDDNNIEDWITYTPIAVYRNRVSSAIYDEDLLKVSIYYGGMVYPETNQGDVWRYFRDKSYDGYLLFDIDESTGKPKRKPGVFQIEKSKELMWQLFQNYIQFRGMKVMHSSLLSEIANLKTFEDLKKNDLAASFGCALLGSNSRSRQLLESVEENIDDSIIDSWYNGNIRY